MNNRIPLVKLQNVMQIRIDAVSVDPSATYMFAGIYSFGRGLFSRGPLLGSETTYKYFHRLHRDQFVMSQVKGWEGALARVPQEYHGFLLSPVYPTFSVDDTCLEVRYLEFFFRQSHTWTQLERMSKGMGARRNSVYPDMLLSMEIPLPPVDEQRRIVAKIERLAGKIEAAQAVRSQATLLSDNLIERSLQDIRERLLRTQLPIKSIGEVAKVTSGGTPSRNVALFWEGDIPWVKTGELRDNDIYTAEERISEAALHNSGAKLFPPDTVLIALYGQGQTRGRTGRLCICAATNQACCAILPTPDVLDARFTQYWLRSYYRPLREVAHGGAQPNWNSGTIKRLPIVLAPLQQQREIVEYLDRIQTKVAGLKALQERSATQLDSLLPGILDRAFKGEL